MSRPRAKLPPMHVRMATELASVRAIVGEPRPGLAQMTEEQLDAWQDRVRAARVHLNLPVNHEDYEQPTRNTYDDNEDEE